MPDYLSPGVYIEELPPALRAIEGVSTSIAGFVGVAERGPVAGFPPPSVPGNPQPPAPSLVTSFADFTRQFGKPLTLPDPNNNNYLAYAVKGFFDNGGSECYVVRIVPSPSSLVGEGTSATYSFAGTYQGTVLSLTQSFNVNDKTLYLNSLRQISAGNVLTLYSQSGAVSPQQLTVTKYDPLAKSVTLNGGVTNKVAVGDAYLVPSGANVTAPTPNAGPVFSAKNPGDWSGSLSIAITPSDRPPTTIPAGGAVGAQQIAVKNAASFYVGAVIEIAQLVPAQPGPPPVPASYGAKIYGAVAGLLPGNVIQLAAPLSAQVAPNSLVRVSEIDITIADPTAIVATSETYQGLAWNPGAGNRHYAAVINANSNLVYVQPPAGEGGQIGQQPTTANGFPITPTTALQAQTAAAGQLAAANSAVKAVVAAIKAVQGAAALPLLPADPLIAAVNQARDQAQSAEAALQVNPLAPNASAAATAAGNAAAAAQAAVTAATAAGANAAAITPSLTAAQNAQAALPAAPAASAPPPAGGVGSNGNASDGSYAGDDDYIGVDNGPGQRTGIQALKDLENVSIIAAPGRTSVTVQSALIDQCELLRYRFAVLDGKSYPNGLQVTDVLAQRDNYDTSYAALYLPWFQITLNNQNVYLPPSGHVVGVYAGTDNSRGVWKAPANVVVQNITGLQSYIVSGEQDILNPAGVNCIRRFDTLGTRVWGARTISSDDSLIYVNVRRTLIFLEASIAQGTQWVVFEPNNQDTWDRVTDSITAFLTTQWANGALFGAKPSDSFFVRCDLTTMTADDIQNGRLICLIGVAIVRPAEFVIFRIEQITGLATQ